MKRNFLVLTLLLLVLSSACGPAPAPTPVPEALFVDPGTSLGPISPYLYGTNYGPMHAVPPEMMPLVEDAGFTVLRFPGQQGAPPQVVPNKTANSVTARATAAVMPLIEKLVQTQDTPRAEILVDVQILEVSKNRTREFGLNLGDYAISGVFSPEVDPRGGQFTQTVERQRLARSRGVEDGEPADVVRKAPLLRVGN